MYYATILVPLYLHLHEGKGVRVFLKGKISRDNDQSPQLHTYVVIFIVPSRVIVYAIHSYLTTEHAMPTQIVVGHVSQETALVVPNYQLNKRLTPLRYWVETRVPYGQRLMKQTFNHRSGVWFTPKPVGVYHDIVVMFFDPSFEPPLQNFSSVGEFVTTHNFNLNTISAEHVDQFKSYYPFDETQLALIDEHFNPAAQTLTEPQQALVTAKRGVGRPAKETDPRLIELQIRQAELAIEKAELAIEKEREIVRAQRLLNEQRERKLAEPVITQTKETKVSDRKPLTEVEKYNVVMSLREYSLEVEIKNNWVLKPHVDIYDADGQPTFEATNEFNDLPKMEEMISYGLEDDKYYPTQYSIFENRARFLNLDISQLKSNQLTQIRQLQAELLASKEKK